MSTNSVTVAILSKVNDLAERYGLKPYEFLATYREDGPIEATDNWAVLSYESGPSELDSQPKWEKMLNDLGAIGGELRGTERSIYEALDNALQRAPKTRSMGDWGRFSSN